MNFSALPSAVGRDVTGITDSEPTTGSNGLLKLPWIPRDEDLVIKDGMCWNCCFGDASARPGETITAPYQFTIMSSIMKLLGVARLEQ